MATVNAPVTASAGRARVRPLLRLALRDAGQHRLRTALMLIVIALPIAACLLLMSATTPEQTPRAAVLASLPEQAQASIIATTLPPPVVQLPERMPDGLRDESITPATPSQVSAVLPPGTTLHEWWSSPQLIATTALDLDPGEQGAASASRMVGDLDIAHLSTLQLREADAGTLPLLLPRLSTGRLPRADTEIVLTSAAAANAGVAVGDTIQLIAPPDTGWRSSDGSIAAVAQDSERAYRVVGLVAPDPDAATVATAHGGAGDATQAYGWALPIWIAPMIEADQTGIDRHYLATGEQPITWQQVRELNRSGVGVIAREPLEHYPSEDQLYPVPVDMRQMVARITLIVLATVGMATVLVALVTPALTVGAARMRRTFGLVVAIGAAPRTAAAMLLLHALGIGVIGAGLGALVGTGGVLMLRALSSRGIAADVTSENPLVRLVAAVLGHAWGPLPWWAPPLLALVGVLLAVLAAVPAVLTAARMDPIDALADRRTRRSRRAADATGVRHRGRGLGRAWLGGPMLRAAVRDAGRHRSRTVPAILATAGCVALTVVIAVVSGSVQTSMVRTDTAMVAPGMVQIGMQTPVNNSVDQRIVHAAADRLREDGLLTQTADIYSLPQGQWVEAEPAPDRTCPKGQGVSPASATTVGAPFACVPELEAYNPGLKFPTWVGNQTTILTPEAMRATRLPGADRAADVLARGGAIVNNATLLRDDGTVVLRLVPGNAPSSDAELGTVPGVFVRGFEPYLAVSPETAARLGLEPRFVGVIGQPTRPLDGAGAERFADHAEEVTTTVWPATNPRPDALGFIRGSASLPMAELALIGAVLLAVVAIAVSVALGQVEAARDVQVMHQIGATPRQLRGYGLARAVVILLFGVLVGLALGAPASVVFVVLLRVSGIFPGLTQLSVLPIPIIGGILAISAGALLVGVVLSGSRAPTGRAPE